MSCLLSYIWIYLKLRKYCHFGTKNARHAWHIFPAQEVKLMNLIRQWRTKKRELLLDIKKCWKFLLKIKHSISYNMICYNMIFSRQCCTTTTIVRNHVQVIMYCLKIDQLSQKEYSKNLLKKFIEGIIVYDLQVPKLKRQRHSMTRHE